MAFKLIALSGTTDVTQNLYVYESGDDMLIVDCGVGFPDADMYGVDLVIPDFTYIMENKNRLRGIIITHGHEDHIGALPFLLKEIKVPVYSTKLVSGFIEDKLAQQKVKDIELKVFNPDEDDISLGVFTIHPFRISHSVPDAVGFAIDTPEGRFFHVADYKFDWTPVDGRPFDIAKAARLADGNIIGLASDCLGSTTPGYTESEMEIEGKIRSISETVNGQIFFTTISSNISRIQQAINVAYFLNRQVALVGRSIESKVEIAKNFGYIHYPDDLVVSVRDLDRLPKNRRMYIISGSYGQNGSALYRVSVGEHDYLEATAGDVVIFSSDPAPPGSKDNVDFVVDHLIGLNVDVHYYDMQEDLHVSGHGSREDIKMLMSIVKPKYFVPIGGTIRHMRAFKTIARDLGYEDSSVFELSAGDILTYENGSAKITGNIPVKNVLVDGLGIGDVGNVVLRDRQVLAGDGIAIVLIKYDGRKGKLLEDPEIISRGFVYQGKGNAFLTSASIKLRSQIERKKFIDRTSVRNITSDFLEKLFFKETKRRPMILPLIVEV